MNYTVKLYGQGLSTELIVEENSNLLKCLQEHVPDFFAPCGGNGSCGKCRVNIVGKGVVTACLYHVNQNIEVILPEQTEISVLSSQYELTKNRKLNLGELKALHNYPLGVAIDLGTTTMVFYFVDLLTGAVVDIKTLANPQAKYGADVISRINYSAVNENGIKHLQSVLIQSINKTIDGYCSKNKKPRQAIVKLSVVGNATMLHTLLGVNALSIAHSPFTPIFTDAKKVNPNAIGINIHGNGEMFLSPSLSGYVGADIVAGLASLDTDKLGENYLFIDIGTNGEMVLVTPNKIISCATAAGPALEGANISCGMSAVAGAISEYTTSGYKVIGGGVPKGLCGSGLVDVIASMLENKALNSDGNIAEDYIIYADDVEQKHIVITQQDVREVQLAKAAIAAGINRLLALCEKSLNDLDHILLAGGFGNYINISHAKRIGLLPQLENEKYILVGNTAGSGAVLALKSESFVSEMEQLKSKMEYVELSTDVEFATEYAMNMFFN